MGTTWVYTFVRLLMLSFVPLCLVGLAGMFSEKGGVTNIALEGIMIVGGFVGILVMNRMAVVFGADPDRINRASRTVTELGPRTLIYLVALISATAAGILFALIHAFAAIKLKADQIITATALNIVAPALCLFLVFSLTLSGVPGVYRLPLDTMLFYIPSFPGLGDIPYIGDALFKGTFPSLFIGLGIMALAPLVLNKTRFGLRLKACGENPYAAAAAGVSVAGYRYAGVALSGALAGMAGFFFASTWSSEYVSSVAGFGFLGLAVMIFGNWKPSLIVLAALLFSFFNTLGSGYNLIPGSSAWQGYENVFKMLPFVVTLVVLVFFSKRNRAPRYDGVPYYTES